VVTHAESEAAKGFVSTALFRFGLGRDKQDDIIIDIVDR
jgi:hypothetical protein